jgi:hypothetical protein
MKKIKDLIKFILFLKFEIFFEIKIYKNKKIKLLVSIIFKKKKKY